MTLQNHRVLHVALVLCSGLALVACGGNPTPVPATATPAAKATAVSTRAAHTPTPTRAPTSDVQESASPTPTSKPPDLGTPTCTATPTGAPLPVATTPAPESRCEGLAGLLEIRVLVGPAEVVGLEPVAVGSVPFAVTTSGTPYLIEGQGPITYDATLTQQWGTYAVTMDLYMVVRGECSGHAGTEQLDLVLEMSGDQLVVVDAGSAFRGEYPWSGTRSLDLAFPLEEGATAQGEGWAVVLHLAGG